jgi:hypothetical protein
MSHIVSLRHADILSALWAWCCISDCTGPLLVIFVPKYSISIKTVHVLPHCSPRIRMQCSCTKFEVSRAVKIHVPVSCVMTPFSVVGVFQLSRGIHCNSISTLKMEAVCSSECWYPLIRLQYEIRLFIINHQKLKVAFKFTSQQINWGIYSRGRNASTIQGFARQPEQFLILVTQSCTNHL